MTEILYENKDMVFILKPSGISSEEQMVSKLKDELNSEIYPLHRLDKPVSGVMVYAKTKAAAAKISEKISSRTDFSKEYLAVIEGKPEENEGIFEDLLFKDSKKNKSFVVKRERKGVKKAVLNYKLIKTAEFEGNAFSLVSVELKTGRSHQIRVQFASRKHPLIGDKKYGSKVISPIGLFSHSVSTCGITIKKNPPDEFPWNLFS